MLVHEEFGLKMGPLSKPRFDKVDVTQYPFYGRLRTIPEKYLLSIMNRGVGVEIEVENNYSFGLEQPWLLVSDTSLRNSGVEYITTYGLRIGNLYKALCYLDDTFHNVRRVAGRPDLFDFSERTSVHGHLDCRHFNESQLENLSGLYTLVENPLFNFAGPGRKDNIFCVPLRESRASGLNVSIYRAASNWERYCAYNLHALREYGTVEFRHMEGNCDPERIFCWIILLALLQEAAKRWSRERVLNLIHQVKGISSYKLALDQIFYGFSDVLLWEEKDLDRAASDAKLMFYSENN